MRVDTLPRGVPVALILHAVQAPEISHPLLLQPMARMEYFEVGAGQGAGHMLGTCNRMPTAPHHNLRVPDRLPSSHLQQRQGFNVMGFIKTPYGEGSGGEAPRGRSQTGSRSWREPVTGSMTRCLPRLICPHMCPLSCPPGIMAGFMLFSMFIMPKLKVGAASCA